MRTVKHFIVILIMIGISIVITQTMDDSNLGVLLIIGITGLIFFNLTIRSKLSMKDYFTSKYNILTSKYELKSNYDIPHDLLFDKVVEVLEGHGYRKVKVDKEKGLIFTPASISFKSWGENLYFTLTKIDENTTELLFESVAFQLYSWGKNEDNANGFYAKLEESLII